MMKQIRNSPFDFAQDKKSEIRNIVFNWIKSPIIILFGIIVLGFLIRIIPYHNAIQNGYINFFEQDPYYHLRRILLGLNHHLLIPNYDSYSGFPQGLHCFWPAFFDVLIAIPAWLIGFGNPNKYTVELVAAFIPPILGALTIIPIYLLTKEIFQLQIRNPQSAIRNNESAANYQLSIPFSNKIALLTAFFYSISPGHIYWTLIGRPDHHCAEPIFPLLMFWSVLVALKNEKSEVRGQKSEKNLPTAHCLLPTIFSGVMLVLSLLIWGGATIFIGILVLYLFILIIIFHGDELKTRYITKLNATLFGTAFLLLLPLCATTYWGKHFLFAYDALSWFQIVLIGAVLAMFVYLGYLSLWLSEKSKWWYLIASIWSGLILLGIIFLLFPSFITHFSSGIGWIIKSDPWLKTITEFQPLFISLGVFSSFRPTSFFGYGFYLLPLVYWILFYRLIKKRPLPGFITDSPIRPFADSGIVWFFLFLILITTLGLMQSRFSHFLAYLVAVGYAFLTLILFERTREIADCGLRIADLFKIRPSYLVLRTSFCLLPTILTAFCLLVLLLPCIREIRTLPGKYAGLPNEWRETLLWLRVHTPPTRFYDEPSKTPEYGILAPWIAGHWINYVAERPTICNGFHTNAENNRAGMQFFLTEDETKANRLLDEKKAKYIILTDLTPNLLEYGKLIETDAGAYIFRLVNHPPQGGTQIAFLPTQQFYRLISSRLYLFDGIDNETRTALGNYRLVYETANQWNVEQEQVSCLKVFEHVKGATIIGHAIPGTKIRISVPIITNTGREFSYVEEVIADYTGTYKFIVPYSTEDSPYSTKAKSSYAITWTKQKKPILVEVTERQVIKGEIINLVGKNSKVN
jgi:dolichyl-diphosphooligosaccharide--protein glycosyltransferase